MSTAKAQDAGARSATAVNWQASEGVGMRGLQFGQTMQGSGIEAWKRRSDEGTERRRDGGTEARRHGGTEARRGIRLSAHGCGTGISWRARRCGEGDSLSGMEVGRRV